MENEIEKLSEALEQLMADHTAQSETDAEEELVIFPPEVPEADEQEPGDAPADAPSQEAVPAEDAQEAALLAQDAPEDEEEEEYIETEEEAAHRQKVHRKRIFRGALRFYTVLFGVVLAVLILLCCLMVPLRTLLEQYEASQPEYVSEEIYDLLFADPDWALLYDMAGIKPTEFEGRDDYVAYMEKKVGSRALTCTEASGTDTLRRYSIRLEGEEVASFTMVPMDDGVSTFSRWTLGEVDVYFSRQESVTVNIMPGYTVYINSIALDESYTTFKLDTAVEALLPEGLHGYRCEQQQISGLLMPPEIIVLDEYNNPVPVTQDPVTGVYSVPITDTVPITQEEYNLALFAARAEALFGIRAIPISELRLYFPAGTESYQQISGADALVESFESYAFDESATVVDGYYRYSENLFSVHARVKLDVTVKDGDVRSFTTDMTYWFTTNYAGDFVPSQRTEENLQQQIIHYGITFVHDGEVLQRQWLSEDDVIVPPAVTLEIAPIAWATTNENGVLIPVLMLQEDGTLALAEGCRMQTMTLYPLFDTSGEQDVTAQ